MSREKTGGFKTRPYDSEIFFANFAFLIVLSMSKDAANFSNPKRAGPDRPLLCDPCALCGEIFSPL